MTDPSDFTPNVDKPEEFSSGVEENDPVPALQSGEGLPYAPINWPKPGDIWGWRVGRRFNTEGYYIDRYLYLPSSLHKPTVSKQLSSKLAVDRYIQSEFPDADIEEFWASFSWKVPALKDSAAVPYSRFSTSKANTPLNKEKKKFTRQLQAEINSNLSVIQGIDNQIAQLQSRRAKLSEILETKKGFVAKLSVDEQVGNGKTTNEIELNSEKPE
ncbi:uncharacterized protein LOC123211289 [Mangifera indica]|uniref:uncharacterized protein LOC123211289 n=1 Tax=Mangifera indica TaxID=29780 RepID=UPI001CFAE459|nr:uncharacterized protein LOC123211289 [Mangifera indica]